VNGYPLKREELKGEFEETVVSTILRQTGELQKAVYNVSIFFYLLFFLLLPPKPSQPPTSAGWEMSTGQSG